MLGFKNAAFSIFWRRRELITLLFFCWVGDAFFLGAISLGRVEDSSLHTDRQDVLESIYLNNFYYHLGPSCKSFDTDNLSKEKQFCSENNWALVSVISGIVRDKTMDDKLIYIPNDDEHNYFICRLKLLVEPVWNQSITI